MADEKPAAPNAGAEADESAYQEQLKKLVAGEEPEDKKPEPKPAEEAKEEPDEPEAEPEAEEADDPDDEESEDEAEGEEKPEEKGKYSKAFRKLQKEEAQLQQFKAQVLAQEREVKQREQTVNKNEAELGQFIKQLRLDPFGTLMKAGLLNEDDAEYASKQLYFHSKAAAADPKSKLEADRLRREREMLLEAQQTRAEVERLRKEREAEVAERNKQAQLDAYVAKFDATIETYKSKTPLLAQALEKNPARTRRELFEIANELSAAKQAFADPGLVVLAWAKQRKALLAELGIKEPAVAKTQKDKSKSAAESKGPPEKSSKPAQSTTDEEAEEAAYQKELRDRLAGKYVD